MGVPVPQDLPTLPKMLKTSGYTTANIGKLHFLPHANRDHRELHPDYGFDHLQISDEPGCYEDAYHAWVRRKAPDQLEHISVGLPPAAEQWNRMMGISDHVQHPPERFPKRAVPFRGSNDVTHTAFVADQTIEFIESHRQQNWMCIAGFYSPHSPWVAPQQFLDLYDPDKLSIPSFPPDVRAVRENQPDYCDQTLRAARQGYYAMISEVDHHVGRILHKLKELDLSEDTLVIFTSDHGEWLGYHLKYGKGFPADDSVSRVPFIMRWPSGIRNAGQTISDIVEAVDMVPTVLEAAGIQAPPHLQGSSLGSYLRGDPKQLKKAALTEGRGWKNIRTRNYRYIVKENQDELLFDLQQDPWEYCDVSSDPNYRETLCDMRKLLLQRVLEMERPLKRIWNY
jgi:arylsulfatase A-like enzyme